MVQTASRIHDEYLVQLDPNVEITNCIGFSVAETSVKRFTVLREKSSDLGQCADFEDVRLPDHHLADAGSYCSIRGHDHWTGWHAQTLLSDACYVALCEISLSDRSCSQVNELVAKLTDLLVKTADIRLSPVKTASREYVSRHIRLSHSAVHV